jgi:adenosylcobinamide amidohydrolase
MTRAFISATDAKRGLMDLMSGFVFGSVNPATGTGTDEIIVVDGQGRLSITPAESPKRGC